MTREEAIHIIEKDIQIDVRSCTNEEVYVFITALNMAIAALREQGGSFQNGNNHNMVKDWPSYMDLPRERIVPDTNVGNKWISVEERLPTRADANPNESVLAIAKDDGFARAWIWDIVERYYGEFTYWMPWPEGPEVDV